MVIIGQCDMVQNGVYVCVHYALIYMSLVTHMVSQVQFCSESAL